ncbi:hypothetical protein ALO_11849 [Acetonema longum DSM 6540]|uniref:Uncharacterized protein n=1 Tax=Acetonema longum DSM 6540 TaxID=1009370 RepID=F7NJW0_9FIRM|nr:hypothetical protein ALO_11849 [Acetonema longum DSM 6540]
MRQHFLRWSSTRTHAAFLMQSGKSTVIMPGCVEEMPFCF